MCRFSPLVHSFALQVTAPVGRSRLRLVLPCAPSLWTAPHKTALAFGQELCSCLHEDNRVYMQGTCTTQDHAHAGRTHKNHTASAAFPGLSLLIVHVEFDTLSPELTSNELFILARGLAEYIKKLDVTPVSLLGFRNRFLALVDAYLKARRRSQIIVCYGAITFRIIVN